MTEPLMMAPGDRPILSVIDDELSGIEALDDSGEVDVKETEKLRHLIAISRRHASE